MCACACATERIDHCAVFSAFSVFSALCVSANCSSSRVCTASQMLLSVCVNGAQTVCLRLSVNRISRTVATKHREDEEKEEEEKGKRKREQRRRTSTEDDWCCYCYCIIIVITPQLQFTQLTEKLVLVLLSVCVLSFTVLLMTFFSAFC